MDKKKNLFYTGFLKITGHSIPLQNTGDRLGILSVIRRGFLAVEFKSSLL